MKKTPKINITKVAKPDGKAVSKVRRQRTTQAQYYKLVLWVDANKAEIQAQLDRGKTVLSYALEQGVAKATLADLFHHAGITLKHGGSHSNKGAVIEALLVVVQRLCFRHNTPHDELAPWLAPSVPEVDDSQPAAFVPQYKNDR